MKIPQWLLRLLPMWEYICPKCKGRVDKRDKKCPHCKEKFGMPIRVPPRFLKDKHELERYVHAKIFPRIASWQREYLSQFFTSFLSSGWEDSGGSDVTDSGKWSGSSNSTGETITVSSTEPYRGSYKAVAYCNGSSSGEYAYVYKTLSSLSTLYIRTYAKFLTALPASGESFSIIQARGTDWIAFARLQNTGGTMYWRLVFHDGATHDSTDWQPDTAIALDTWYCIMLKVVIDGSTGEYRLYIDGAERITETGLDTNEHGTITRGDVGEVYSTGTTAHYIHVDCVEMSDEFINPEPSVEYFKDDFENDFTPWTNTFQSGATITATSGNAHHGSKQAQLTGLDSDSDNAGIYKDSSIGLQDLFMRVYLYMTALPTGDDGDHLNIGPMYRDGSDNGIANGCLQKSGSTWKWGMRIRLSSGWTTYVESGTSTVSASTWYCMDCRLYVHASNGLLQTWIDGELKLNQTGIDSTYRGTVDRFGLQVYIDVGMLAFGSSDQVRYDCFVASDGFISMEPAGSYIVDDTPTTYQNVEANTQWATFYANGRHWVFYSDGSVLKYATSPNGQYWSIMTYPSANNSSITRGERFGIYYKDGYVHLVYSRHASDDPVRYRRGFPCANGIIIWDTEQNAVPAGGSGVYFRDVSIGVDSEDKPWIGYRRDYSSELRPYVTKSSVAGGGWTTQGGFPYNLSTSDYDWEINIIPLTGGKCGILFRPDDQDIDVRCRIWNGSSWESEEWASVTAPDEEICAVADGDHIHFAYVELTTKHIKYRKRTWGTGWGTTETVMSSATNALIANLVFVSTNNLYMVWSYHPTSQAIYYRKFVNGTWEGSYYKWVSEAMGLTHAEQHSCWREREQNMIGMAYTTDASSPYTVRYTILGNEVLLSESPLDERDEDTRVRDLHPSDSIYKSAEGQSFQMPSGSAYKITKALFMLKKDASPTGNLTARLYAYSGSWPSGTVGSLLATSDGYDVSTLNGSVFEPITFVFTGAQQYEMQPSTAYWIVCVAPESGTIDTTNLFRVGQDTGGGHAGNPCNYTNGSWSATNTSDRPHEVWGIEVEEAGPKQFTKTSDARVYHVHEFTKNSDARVFAEQQVQKTSDARVKKTQQIQKTSDARVKAEQEFNKNSDARVKAEQYFDKLSDTRVKVEGQQFTKDSDARVKVEGQEFTKPSDARVFEEQEFTKQSDARVKAEQEFTKFSDARVWKTQQIQKTSDAKVLQLYEEDYKSDARVFAEQEIQKTSDTRVKKTQQFTKTSDAQVFRGIIIYSNARVYHEHQFTKLSDARIVLRQEFTKNSDARVFAEQELTKYSDAVVWTTQQIQKTSDTRIVLRQEFTKNSDARIKATQELNKLSDAVVWETQEFSKLSDAIVYVEQELQKLSDARVKATQEFVKLSDGRVYHVHEFAKPSDSRVFVEKEISKFSDAIVWKTQELQKLSDSRVYVTKIITKNSDARIYIFYEPFTMEIEAVQPIEQNMEGLHPINQEFTGIEVIEMKIEEVIV